MQTTRIEVRKCMHCHKRHRPYLEVPSAAAFAWRQGAHVQTAFPMLTPEEREMLITGMDDNCWNEYLGPEEEE